MMMMMIIIIIMMMMVMMTATIAITTSKDTTLSWDNPFESRHGHILLKISFFFNSVVLQSLYVQSFVSCAIADVLCD